MQPFVEKDEALEWAENLVKNKQLGGNFCCNIFFSLDRPFIAVQCVVEKQPIGHVNAYTLSFISPPIIQEVTDDGVETIGCDDQSYLSGLFYLSASASMFAQAEYGSTAYGLELVDVVMDVNEQSRFEKVPPGQFVALMTVEPDVANLLRTLYAQHFRVNNMRCKREEEEGSGDSEHQRGLSLSKDLLKQLFPDGIDGMDSTGGNEGEGGNK